MMLITHHFRLDQVIDTKNIMMKAEYVNQQYQNFAPTDIRSGGKFNGVMIEASLAF